MNKLVLVALAALLVASCADRFDQGGRGGGTDTGADSDTDSDTASDTASDTDSAIDRFTWIGLTKGAD